MSFRKCATVLLGLVLLYIPLFSQGFDSKDPSIDSKDPSIAILLGNDGRAEHNKLLEDSGEDWETSLAWGKQLFFSGQAIDPPPGFQIKVKDHDGIETEEINAAKFLKKNPASPLAEFLKGRKKIKLSEHLSAVTEFTCNRCHNHSREDYFPQKEDPEERYKFILKRIEEGKKDVFMAPSPTLWGAVNREDFYAQQEAVRLKYRELDIPNFFDEAVDVYPNGVEKMACKTQATRNVAADPAKVSIGAAVHLCGSYCNVAKKDPKTEKNFLKPWEYRALMTLLWEKELRLSDLELDKNELAKAGELIQELLKPNPDAEIVKTNRKIIEEKLLKKANGNPRNRVPQAENGDVERGKMLYSLSCARCHRGQGSPVGGPALRLQPNVHDAAKIKKAVDNLSHVFDNPTPYMPNFPKERLSVQQVEDIMAFILSR